MAVVTGLGVILAISASRSFAPASVCLASTTMTPVLPMMIVLFPPAPPMPAHTSGFSIFIVIGGGAGGACCAVPEMASAPPTTMASQMQRGFTFDIALVLSGPELYYVLPKLSCGSTNPPPDSRSRLESDLHDS